MKYIDTQKVIAAVQCRPLLWKRKHGLYKEKEARENAWREVSNAVMPDYNCLSEIEQQAADKRIQQRWRTARDTYIKTKFAEESQLPGWADKKKYAFYDMLSFLDGAGRRVPRQYNELNDESSGEESLAETARKTAPLPATKAPPSEPEKKRKRKDKESNIEQSNELELAKEDLAFFQSLQPTLKRFNNYQKMMFRTKILQVIMDMEAPNVHEADVTYTPAANVTNEVRSSQFDPMSYTITVKSEVEPDDDTNDENI